MSEKDAKMSLSHAQFPGSVEGLQPLPTELTLTDTWAGDSEHCGGWLVVRGLGLTAGE